MTLLSRLCRYVNITRSPSLFGNLFYHGKLCWFTLCFPSFSIHLSRPDLIDFFPLCCIPTHISASPQGPLAFHLSPFRFSWFVGKEWRGRKGHVGVWSISREGGKEKKQTSKTENLCVRYSGITYSLCAKICSIPKKLG